MGPRLQGVCLDLRCDDASRVAGPERVEPVWVQAVSLHAPTRPVMADLERVYLSATSGVGALDAGSGRETWAATGFWGGRVGPPYVVVGRTVVMAPLGGLTGIRALDGVPLWTREGIPHESLAKGDDGVFFATDGEVLAAYDAATGADLWRFPLERRERAGDVDLVSGGDVLCARRPAPPSHWRLVCLRTSDGELLWARFMETGFSSADRGDDRGSTVGIGRDRILILGSESEEGRSGVGLDSRTGETVWESAVLRGRGLAVSSDGRVAYACGNGCGAVRTEDGEALWRSDGPQQAGVPAVGDGWIATVGSDGALYVLDAVTGLERERLVPDPTDFGFLGTPAVAGDLVFVFGHSNLYAYRIP